MKHGTHVYACLIGNWINLSDDPNCKMGEHMVHPNTWWEENAPIWSPFEKQEENTMYQQDYIYISYKGADYRVHPSFIQIIKA